MRRACDWMSRGERGRRRELSAGAPRVPRARPVPRVERGVLRVQPVAREAALEARRTQPVPREVPEAPRRAPRARPVPRDAPLVPRRLRRKRPAPRVERDAPLGERGARPEERTKRRSVVREDVAPLEPPIPVVSSGRRVIVFPIFDTVCHFRHAETFGW